MAMRPLIALFALFALFALTALTTVGALACSQPKAADPPLVATQKPTPEREAGGTASSASVAGLRAAPATAAPEPCGALSCTQYTTAKAAFATVLASRPAIVAVGEAHAQKGTEHIASATARFTADLLPLLRHDKSDLVLELMMPDPKCKKQTARVEKNVEKPVTKTQRAGNKTEFQKMAEAAKGMGVRPHVLRPSCAQLEQVANAGDDGVLKMLSLIANLSGDMTKRILQRNQKTSVSKGVVLYGGAMHNDLSPRDGRESFSFGPALSKHVNGRYVEIDLIVPEYIKDTDAWRAFPWYAHYDAAKLGSRVTLFETGPNSFTLIFASQP